MHLKILSVEWINRILIFYFQIKKCRMYQSFRIFWSYLFKSTIWTISISLMRRSSEAFGREIDIGQGLWVGRSCVNLESVICDNVVFALFLTAKWPPEVDPRVSIISWRLRDEIALKVSKAWSGNETVLLVGAVIRILHRLCAFKDSVKGIDLSLNKQCTSDAMFSFSLCCSHSSLSRPLSRLTILSASWM